MSDRRDFDALLGELPAILRPELERAGRIGATAAVRLIGEHLVALAEELEREEK